MYTIRSKREKIRSLNGFWKSKIWSHPDRTTSTVHLDRTICILASNRTLVYKPAWNTWALTPGQVTVGTPKISKDGSFHDVSIFIEPWYCISMIPSWYPMFLPYFTGVSWFALHFYWLNHDSAPTTAFRPNWGHSLPGSSAGWVGTPGWIYVENPTYGGYMDTKPMLFISTLELGENRPSLIYFPCTCTISLYISMINDAHTHTQIIYIYIYNLGGQLCGWLGEKNPERSLAKWVILEGLGLINSQSLFNAFYGTYVKQCPYASL